MDILHNKDRKCALITGGTKGIGFSIANAFVDANWSVVLTYNNDQDAACLAQQQLQEKGATCVLIQNDISSENAVAVLMDALANQNIIIDCLVNNAARTIRETVLDITLDSFRNIIKSNVEYPFFLAQAISQYMIERQKPGSIINIASVSASRARSKMVHYQISKAGLVSMTKSLAFELAPYLIRVNSISPGLVQTDANKEHWQDNPSLWNARAKDIPLQRCGKPEDFGAMAVLLASDSSAWITGSDIIIDGGLSTV